MNYGKYETMDILSEGLRSALDAFQWALSQKDITIDYDEESGAYKVFVDGIMRCEGSTPLAAVSGARDKRKGGK